MSCEHPAPCWYENSAGQHAVRWCPLCGAASFEDSPWCAPTAVVPVVEVKRFVPLLEGLADIWEQHADDLITEGIALNERYGEPIDTATAPEQFAALIADIRRLAAVLVGRAGRLN